MIAFLKRWLSERSERRVPTEPAQDTRDAFRADLIPVLHAEHRELLALFARMEQASLLDDEHTCRAVLQRFTALLREHLSTENRHLYGYFSRRADAHPDASRQVAQMSTEMLRIGRELHGFIATYSQGEWSRDQQIQLRKDVYRVGAILRRRIDAEESRLYPLYQASSAAH
ncbi:MAG: hemerythrin domain-containing protein [Tahibacter sp.]